jgi:hypothetical protein
MDAKMPTLRDVVEKIDDLNDDLTLYLAPEWTPKSRVVVAREPDGGGLPDEAAAVGASYFLEVAIAKEVIHDLKWLNLDARTERLIRYAISDA